MQKVTEMKLPYFPFYASDFLSDTEELTNAEAGAYVRLLIHQWKNKSLPKLLTGKLLCYLDEWPNIEQYFPLCDDARRRNPRLEKEREKIISRREKQSEGGKKSASQNKLAPKLLNKLAPKLPPNIAESESESDKESEKNKDSINEALLPFLSLAAKFHDTQAKNWPKQTVFKTSLRAKTDLTGADALEKLHRLDGWSMDEISDLLEWIPEDEFWRVNIRSLGNIRKKSSRNDAKKIENAQASMQRNPKEKSITDLVNEARERQGLDVIKD